jgi:hypothetical protein
MVTFADRRCTIIDHRKTEEKNDGNRYRCLKPVHAVVKVKLFWSDTFRHSWQTWYLCKVHYDWFLQDQGEGWYCKKKHRPKAPVVDFEFI